MYKMLIASAAIFGLSMVAATAQTAAPVSNTLDLGPAIHQIFTYVNIMVPIAVIMLVGWLGNKFGVGALTSNTMLHNSLERAIQYGLNAVEGAVEGKSMSVPIASDVLRHALEYAVQYVPQLLAGHNLDPGSVVKLLMGHLPTVEGAISADEVNSIVAAAISSGVVKIPATIVTSPAPP